MAYPTKPTGDDIIPDQVFAENDANKISMTTEELAAGYSNKNEVATPLTSVADAHKMNAFLNQLHNTVKYLDELGDSLKTDKQDALNVSIKGQMYAAGSSNSINIIAPNATETKKYLAQTSSDISWQEIALKESRLWYSNNRGLLNSTGQAEFASKVDNDTVLITASDDNTKLIMTGSQGTEKVIETSNNITGFTDDATNYVLWDYENNQEIVTANTVYESNLLPTASDGVDGDYWLTFFGRNDYIGFKKVSGSWVELEFSKMFEVTKASGVLGTPISYAFNGKYVSPDIALATSTSETTVFYHNIGTKKINVKPLQLRCITANINFSVGDITTVHTNRGLSNLLTPVIKSNNSMAVVTGNYSVYELFDYSGGGGTSGFTKSYWNQFASAERAF